MQQKIKNIMIEKKEKLFAKFKNLTLKNYVNIVLLLFILISATYVFFQYKLIFFPDSQVYYSLADMILGKSSFSNWNLDRGFGFPLIIAIWSKLFGDTSKGLLIGCFTCYLFLILGLGYLLQKFMKKNEVKNKGLFFILYLLLIVYNPLIIGYHHTLLTEAVMPGIFLLVIFLCLKWYNVTYKENKKMYIFLTILFVLLATFIWFIKQPYAPTFYMAIFVTAILVGIRYKSWKVFGKRMITVILCLLFMTLSIIGWNFFISRADVSANNRNYSYLNDGILSGLGVYYEKEEKDTFCNEEYIENLNLNPKEKEKIKELKYQQENWCSHLAIYKIKDKDKRDIATEVIISKGESISLKDNVLFLIKNIIKHPTLVMKSYFYNYLAIADIQERQINGIYRSSLEYSPNVVGENGSNGIYALTLDNETVISASEPVFQKFNTSTTPSNIDLLNILLIHNSLCFYLYKIGVLLAFPIGIYSFIEFCKKKSKTYFMLTLLSLTSFMDAFFHTVMGAIIDRYVYPVYPLMLFVILLLFMENKVEKEKTLN